MLLACCFLLDLAGGLSCAAERAAQGQAAFSQAGTPAHSLPALPFLPCEEPEPEGENYSPEDDFLHPQGAGRLSPAQPASALRPDGSLHKALSWAASLFQPPEPVA